MAASPRGNLGCKCQTWYILTYPVHSFLWLNVTLCIRDNISILKYLNQFISWFYLLTDNHIASLDIRWIPFLEKNLLGVTVLTCNSVYLYFTNEPTNITTTYNFAQVSIITSWLPETCKIPQILVFSVPHLIHAMVLHHSLDVCMPSLCPAENGPFSRLSWWPPA